MYETAAMSRTAGNRFLPTAPERRKGVLARFSLRALCALVALSTSGLVAIQSWHAWRQEVSEVETELVTVTEVGGRAVAVYLDQLELALKSLSQEIEKESQGQSESYLGSAAVVEAVRKFNREHVELTNVVVVSPDGRVLASAKDGTEMGQITLANEDSFRAFPKVSLYWLDIGRPMVDHATRRWVVPVRYAVDDQGQSLKYLISAHLPVEFFSSFWRNSAITKKGSIGLLRDDAFLLSRHPVAERVADKSLYGRPRTGELSAYLNKHRYPRRGAVRAFNTTEQEDCLNVFTRLPNYNLTLFVSVPMRVILSAWWKKAQSSFVLFGVFLAGGALVYYVAATRQRDYEASLAEALAASGK